MEPTNNQPSGSVQGYPKEPEKKETTSPNNVAATSGTKTDGISAGNDLKALHPDNSIASRAAKTVVKVLDTLRGYTPSLPREEAPSKEQSSNSDDNGEPKLTFGPTINSQEELERAIRDARGFETDPKPLNLIEATESPESAKQYVENTDNSNMNLDELLKRVKNIKDRVIKEEHFTKIFEAKTSDEWWHYAIEKVMMTDSFEKNFIEGIEQNNSIGQKGRDSNKLLMAGLNYCLSKTTKERKVQVKELDFLVKKYSALHLSSKTNLSNLTDKLDKLIDGTLSTSDDPQYLPEKITAITSRLLPSEESGI
ncbi:hypothetical protein ACH42_12115 [Endozoicomonas sp. (ex Bugula neritina AB1)]|nr:hypothetical protein ACH42_12115 [Endozoicomonas sp. (ex Bugula neritina AB1)]